MNHLIKFFSVLLGILGQFSPFVANIGKMFFTSFDAMCKSIDRGHSFIKYVVCLNCNQIYKYEQCIDMTGTEQSSKRCHYVEFPRHPHERRRQPCGTLLLKTVELTSKSVKQKLYPFKVYCYNTLNTSMQSLLLRKDFILNCSLWKQKQSSGNEIEDIYMMHVYGKNFRCLTETIFLIKSTPLVLF